MDFKEIGINKIKWVDSALDRNYWRALLNATLNLQAMELINVIVFQQEKFRASTLD